MRKMNIILGFIIAILFVSLGIIGVLIYSGNGRKKQETDAESSLYVPDEESISVDESTGKVYVNDIVIIFFNPGVTQEEINATIQSISGTIVGNIRTIDQYQVRISPRTLEELEIVCDKLRTLDCVFDAVYDEAFEVSQDVIPNDPWTKSWFTENETWSESSPDGANWWLEAIEAPSAWENNAEFHSIKIGVIDDGFDDGHEDLKNRICSTSPINNKAKHGTHVSGIIGAEPNNDKGITGVVWNCELYTYDWKLNISQEMANFIFNNEWSTFNQIFGGTSILVESGAKVINLSAGQTGSMSGTTRSNEEVNSNGYYASLYLHALLSRGYDFLIVQSAGNGNSDNRSVDAVFNGHYCSINESNCVTSSDISYHDIVGRVVVVGAAQNNGNNSYSQPDWSNAGSRVDICAPGEKIYSTIPGGLSGKYGYESGTSMAAPVVSGVASLVWSVNEKLSGLDVKKIICDEKNTKYIVSDNTSEKHPLVNSYRLINAKMSVEAAKKYEKTSEKKVEEKPSKESITENPAVTYEDILSEYKRAAESNFDTSVLQQSQYINEGVWNFNGQDKYSVYYRIADLADDGTPELIISVNEKEAPENIVDIYGMDNGTAVRLIENSSSVGYRSRYDICKDNRIKNTGSGGALDTVICYYKLKPDSHLLELEEQYVYNGWDCATYTYVDKNNISTEISQEEYDYHYSGQDVDFTSEWKLLYEGHFIHYTE